MNKPTKIVHKGETIGNLPAKTYFYRRNYDGVDVFGYEKLILSDRMDGFENYKMLKQYKDRILFYQQGAFKVGTIVHALDILFGNTEIE